MNHSPLLIQAALRLLFPASCVLCRKPLDLLENVLCKTCFCMLRVLEDPVCKTCSRPLPRFGEHSSRCGECKRMKVYIKSMTAAVPFDDFHRPLIHAVKFHKKRWVFDVYEPFIKLRLEKADLPDIDFLLPIPMDHARKRTREFNQAKDLADQTGRILIKPVLENILKRRGGHHSQSLLGKKERMQNIQSQFYAPRTEKIRDKTILLIDDIFTTGATVNECARILREAGAKEVHAFVLARAIPA